MGATPDELTNYRLEMIEQTLKAVNENLERLAALEAKHIETREALGRAFDQLDKQDTRVRAIELEMPTLQLVRGWVITGAVTLIGLFAVALAGYFKIGPK